MEFPTSDSDVIGEKQNTCINYFYFFSCLGALLLNVMTFCFLRRVYARHVIQMFINTGIKFVVQIQVLKNHPIYYMYIGPVYIVL
jgi:hypothetical protein